MNKKQLIFLAISILAITFSSCVKEEIKPPVADFFAQSMQVDMGESIGFYDNSENDVSSYLWSFSGGYPTTSSEKNPEVSFNSPGFHTVSLTVSNEGGSDTKTIVDMIEVLASAPNVDFIANKTYVQAGELIQLTDISTGADPSILLYKWLNIYMPNGEVLYFHDFEDIVSFSPTVPGYYDVKLTIGTTYGEGIELKLNMIEVYAPSLTIDNTTPSAITVEYEGESEIILSGESEKIYDTDGDLSIMYRITTRSNYGLELGTSYESIDLSSGDKTINFEISSDYFFLTFNTSTIEYFNKFIVNAGLQSELTTFVDVSFWEGEERLGYYKKWSNTRIEAHFRDNNSYAYWENISWNTLSSINTVLNLNYNSKNHTFLEGGFGLPLKGAS